MTILIIILAYIANIFIARFFNKLATKYEHISAPFIWFFPIIGVLVFIIIYLTEIFRVDKKSNWFTGKNW